MSRFTGLIQHPPAIFLKTKIPVNALPTPCDDEPVGISDSMSQGGIGGTNLSLRAGPAPPQAP
jgi:hypothetical protein